MREKGERSRGWGRYTLAVGTLYPWLFVVVAYCWLLLYWRGGGAAGAEEGEELLKRREQICWRGAAGEEGEERVD